MKNNKLTTRQFYDILFVNPTPVQGGGRFLAPYQKMAITPNNNLEEPKLRTLINANANKQLICNIVIS